jgi:pyocin large subunit-like protein
MYTAIFAIGSAVVAYAGMKFHGLSAMMAGGFVVASMAIGMAADLMRAKQRAAAK